MSKAVWLQSGGNNVGGLKRTLFVFDEEALELRPVDVKRIELQADVDLIVKWITENPGRPQKDIEEGVEISLHRVRNALKAATSDRRANFSSIPLVESSRRASNAKYWYPIDHKNLRSSDEQLTSIDEHAADPS